MTIEMSSALTQETILGSSSSEQSTQRHDRERSSSLLGTTNITTPMGLGPKSIVFRLAVITSLSSRLVSSTQWRKDLLRDLEGVVTSGQMLLVLGRPGSGCTTLLKTLAGNTHGLHIEPTPEINLEGERNCILI